MSSHGSGARKVLARYASVAGNIDLTKLHRENRVTINSNDVSMCPHASEALAQAKKLADTSKAERDFKVASTLVDAPSVRLRLLRQLPALPSLMPLLLLRLRAALTTISSTLLSSRIRTTTIRTAISITSTFLRPSSQLLTLPT